MLDYTTLGDRSRPALVLLHAGGMTRREWDPFLGAWSEQFFLIVPTALGHGGSPSVPALTIREMAETTLELLDSLGIPRAHFLGSSMGGAIALWSALQSPERVDRLVLFRSSYRTTPDIHHAALKLAEPDSWRRWGLEGFLRREHSPQGGPEAWIQVVQRVAGMLEPGSSEHAHTLADLGRIQSPTLLISGDRDPLVPLEEALAMYRTIPDASLWVVPRATHLMATESWRRRTFEEEVLRFLARSYPVPSWLPAEVKA